MDESRPSLGSVAERPEAGEPSRDEPRPPRLPAWRAFDPGWYLRRHPDAVAHMERLGTDDVEAYYWQYGGSLGHSPNIFFDESYYLATYPDVAAHVAGGGAPSGFEHYIRHGFAGRSPHWLFDEHRYRALYPDLGDPSEPPPGFVNGYDHFLFHGDHEGRSGHRFFEQALYRSGVTESEALAALPGGPFQHFLRDGGTAANTARLSWYFDPDWYLRTYPDVAVDVEDGLWSSALHHYLCNRMPWRYSPNAWFSEDFYTATYPDAMKEISTGKFRNAYEHFIRFGAAEGRKPHDSVDLAAHLATPKARADLGAGLHRDGFAHWIASRALPTEQPVFDAEEYSKATYRRMAEARLSLFARRPLDFTAHGTPALSVIMVVHNQFALTMTTLWSLRSNYAGAIELILVDSGSTDRSVALDRVVLGARHIRFDDNVSFVLGCNAALAHVSAPAVLFLNNDVTLGYAAVERALARLTGRRGIGAVGAKVIRTNGMLQEAGCIVWRSGATVGYMRGADPDLPEVNFVRDVDFCSGAFLLVRTDCLKRLGGFDVAFAPAYYEETDLCVRLLEAGYRVLYDPEIVIEHVEYATSGALQSGELIARNHAAFARKHADWLRGKHEQADGNMLAASRPGQSAGRILFIEDQVPLRRLGSGFVRSNDLVRCMSALGYAVSVYPLFPADLSPVEILASFPDDVEVLHDRGLDALPQFIQDRAGSFDLLWVGRTHNLHRLQQLIDDAGTALPGSTLVLDTEAVTAPRTIEQARVLQRPHEETLSAMLRRELAPAAACRRIVAVNAIDAELIRQTGLGQVAVLGHMLRPAPTPSNWRDRAGLLFLGALHDPAGPNYDSLVWFVSEVLPLLDPLLPADVRFTVAGFVAPGLDLAPLKHDRVDLVGAVDDPATLYNTHRIFVAPTRFAGGIPFKVHEAAAHGLPVVASASLCRQVGWVDGEDILSGGADDCELFATRILSLYGDEASWYAIRDSALARIRLENDPDDYQVALGGILEAALRTAVQA